jgi:hypothetical protein
MAKMSERTKTILAKYDLAPSEACWDCHGTTVIKHWALERIAQGAGITFQFPHIMEADGGNGVASMLVVGEMPIPGVEGTEDGKITEWSTGEASPANCTSVSAKYPWSMAEKRGKDRVILKLIGLHGLVYSEQEAAEFEEEKKNQKGYLPSMKSFNKDADEDFPSREINLDTVDGWEDFDKLMRSEMEASENLGQLVALWKDNTASLTEYESLFKTSHEALRKAFTAKKGTFK